LLGFPYSDLLNLPDPGFLDLHVPNDFIVDLKISDKISMIIMSFINITNEGKTRDQRRPVLKNCLLTYNVTLEEFNECNGYDRARIKLAGLSLLESEEKEIDGSSIQPSKKPVLDENGNLDISVCKGEPIVYTNINNPEKSNLLDFNSKTEFNDSLKQLDLCINFPVAEITYKADFDKFDIDSYIDDDLYVHLNGKPITNNFNKPLHQLNFSKPLNSKLISGIINW
ncbi:18492_t:CDS:2, partial [Rhizophagus irregularis]